MPHPNLELIDRFFQAYGAGDRERLRTVTTDDVSWTFPGRHPLAGTYEGIDQVIAFFDAMGRVMGMSNVKVVPLVEGVSDGYVSQCQRVTTHREDGNNIAHEWCVLWTFRDGKIAAGRHLAADQQAVDLFFTHFGIRGS